MENPEPDVVTTGRTSDVSDAPGVPVFDAKNVSIYYGSFRAVTDVSLTTYEHEITAGAEAIAAAGGAAPASTLGLSPVAVQTGQHAKLGRNDPCWCGSGKKFKKCHGA